MEYYAEILTMWTGTGTEQDSFRPSITEDHPTILSYEDITGQPSANLTPAPNQFVAKVKVDQPTLDAIEADANYYVLSSEEIPEDII